MAEKINLLNINIDGQEYGLGINTSDIYASLGLTEDRFVELLARDFFTPTLASAPTAETLVYTDTDGSENHFQVGQQARVADSEVPEACALYFFAGTLDGKAIWLRLPNHDPMTMTYIEQWDHAKVPYRSGSTIKFNQEFFVALKTTSEPPIPLVYMDEGVVAKVDEHTYATVGCYEAAGNKEDWKKIPYDELRLTSREGTLNGQAVSIDDLSGEEVYQFEPNLYIDMKRGTINGIKGTELIARLKRIEDKLGL